MGGRLETFYGLTGIGDLIVTCASMHSRNRRAGILIGKGATMDEAMAEVKMVVEGVYSAKAGLALAKKYNVSMPIIEQVNKVLFEGAPEPIPILWIWVTAVTAAICLAAACYVIPLMKREGLLPVKILPRWNMR